MYLKPPSTWQRPLASLFVGGSGGTGGGKAWVSVTRYDDGYVEELRKLDKAESGPDQVTWGGVGGDGSHDAKRMFRRCGKLVSAGPKSEVGQGLDIHTRVSIERVDISDFRTTSFIISSRIRRTRQELCSNEIENSG